MFAALVFPVPLEAAPIMKPFVSEKQAIKSSLHFNPAWRQYNGISNIVYRGASFMSDSITEKIPESTEFGK
jgi:hypothetical protein